MGGGVRSELRDQVVHRIVEQRSLVLAGEMGVGKSHLLAAAIGELRTLGAYSSLGVSGRAELVSLYGDPTCHGAVGP